MRRSLEAVAVIVVPSAVLIVLGAVAGDWLILGAGVVAVLVAIGALALARWGL